MGARLIKAIAGAAVLVGGLAIAVASLIHPVVPRVVVPVLRYHDAIYTGCGAFQQLRDGRYIVKACREDARVDASKVEAPLLAIQRDEPAGPAVVPLAEGHALYLDRSSIVSRIQGQDLGRRLVGHTGGRHVLLTRHPVSDARTLAQVLRADTALAFNEPGYLQLEPLYAQAGRATIIENKARLAPLIRDALAAPVAWRARTSGEPYSVTLIASNGNPARFTYYPAADLLIYHLRLSDDEVVGIPVRAPSRFRDQLKAAQR